MKEEKAGGFEVTLSHEEVIGSVTSKITASCSGITSIQDASAFLTAALTAIGSSFIAHEPQTKCPVANLDRGFLHDGQSGVSK